MPKIIQFGQNQQDSQKPKDSDHQNDNENSKEKRLPNHILSEPSGPPKLTGMSSFEFNTESGGLPSSIHYFGNSQINKHIEFVDEEMRQKYCK